MKEDYLKSYNEKIEYYNNEINRLLYDRDNFNTKIYELTNTIDVGTIVKLCEQEDV
jgi:hypothetical protein